MKKGTLKICIGIFLCLAALIELSDQNSAKIGIDLFWIAFGVGLALWGYRQRKKSPLPTTVVGNSPSQEPEKPSRKRVELREAFRTSREQFNRDMALQKSKREKAVAFQCEGPRIAEIIADCVAIIDRTKNLDVALGRFDTLREQYLRLFEITPSNEVIPIIVPGWINRSNITCIEDLSCIDDAKIAYTRDFHNKKIDLELLKAQSLTDKKLKTSQLKKAMKAALDALTNFPDDGKLRVRISEIETQIADI